MRGGDDKGREERNKRDRAGYCVGLGVGGVVGDLVGYEFC